MDLRGDWGPWPQDTDLGIEMGSDGSSDLSSSSDGTPLSSTGVPVSPGPSGEGDEEIREPPPKVVPPEHGIGSVSYRAVDGALLVIYRGEELRVELPIGVSRKSTIVSSIQLGDWSPFHEVMAWGNSQLEWSVGPASSQDWGIPLIEIAIGQLDPESEVEPLEASEHSGQGLCNEEEAVSENRWPSVGAGTSSASECESPDSIGASWWVQALDQVGWLGWMFFSSCFVLGFVGLSWFLWSFVEEFAISGSFGKGSQTQRVDVRAAWLTVWVLSVLHRGGVMLRGLEWNPRSVSFGQASRPRGVTIELPGCSRLWIWLWLVILFGLAEPNEAKGGLKSDDGQRQVALPITSVLVSPAEGVCAES